jgi:hypothetical protein
MTHFLPGRWYRERLYPAIVAVKQLNINAPTEMIKLWKKDLKLNKEAFVKRLKLSKVTFCGINVGGYPIASSEVLNVELRSQ